MDSMLLQRLLQLLHAITALILRTRCTPSRTDLDTLRQAVIEEHLHHTADELLQSASITSEPLLVSLIHFISDRSCLGIWNTIILMECLAQTATD